MIFVQKSNEDLLVLEFQGSFENLDLFDAHFNSSTLTMSFTDFTLQGRATSAQYSVFERVGDEIKQIHTAAKVILFDQPPRFRLQTAGDPALL